MANPEHLEILKQGVDAWNKWRRAHADIPDLGGADLRGLDLSFANFVQASLDGADFGGANLAGAHLLSAHLRGANFRDTLLPDTDFCAARLETTDLGGLTLAGTTFNYASLRGADFTGAEFNAADLTGASLAGAKFNRAFVGGTAFANVDLREVEGLESVEHFAASEVSASTLYRSGGQISEEFLRGCGLKDWEIEASKLYRTDLTREQIVELTYKVIELRTDPLIQFNSCFISYSSQDEEFARRLHSDLQRSGVRCWFAPEDMKIGDRIRPRLDDSIRLHDKLLLVLSEASVASQWIEQEVETALERERERGGEVLFPVRLDEAVMNARRGWPAFVRKTRHIGDFRNWREPGEYRQGFKRLLDDLRLRP